MGNITENDRRRFEDGMEDIGLKVPPGGLLFNDRNNRVSDASGKKNAGQYRITDADTPHFDAHNFKTDEHVRVYAEKERQRQTRTRRTERPQSDTAAPRVDPKVTQDEVALRQQTILDRLCKPMTAELATPYMQKKQISVPTPNSYVKEIASATETSEARRALVLPGVNIEGELRTLQTIMDDQDGKNMKLFATGAQKTATMHVMADTSVEALKTAKAVVIAEGYSTGATIHKALGARTEGSTPEVVVVLGYDASNVGNVARAIRGAHPKIGIVMAADDDVVNQVVGHGNTGYEKAGKAAHDVNGIVVTPQFADGEQGEKAYIQKFDALALPANKRGLRLLPETLSEADREEVERLEKIVSSHNDFNDLELNSSQGLAGVSSQIEQAVTNAVRLSNPGERLIETNDVTMPPAQVETHSEQMAAHAESVEAPTAEPNETLQTNNAPSLSAVNALDAAKVVELLETNFSKGQIEAMYEAQVDYNVRAHMEHFMPKREAPPEEAYETYSRLGALTGALANIEDLTVSNLYRNALRQGLTPEDSADYTTFEANNDRYKYHLNQAAGIESGQPLPLNDFVQSYNGLRSLGKKFQQEQDTFDHYKNNMVLNYLHLNQEDMQTFNQAVQKLTHHNALSETDRKSFRELSKIMNNEGTPPYDLLELYEQHKGLVPNDYAPLPDLHKGIELPEAQKESVARPTPFESTKDADVAHAGGDFEADNILSPVLDEKLKQVVQPEPIPSTQATNPAPNAINDSPHSDTLTNETEFEKFAVPDALEKRYDRRQSADKTHVILYERGSNMPAITDHDNKLSTGKESLAVIRDMVAIAQHRGWETIKAKGSEEYRRMVWQEGTRLGINVEGYKPDDIEQARMARELAAKHNQSIEQVGMTEKQRTSAEELSKKWNDSTPEQRATDPSLRNAQSQYVAIKSVIAEANSNNPEAIKTLTEMAHKIISEELAKGNQFKPAQMAVPIIDTQSVNDKPGYKPDNRAHKMAM